MACGRGCRPLPRQPQDNGRAGARPARGRPPNRRRRHATRSMTARPTAAHVEVGRAGLQTRHQHFAREGGLPGRAHAGHFPDRPQRNHPHTAGGLGRRPGHQGRTGAGVRRRLHTPRGRIRLPDRRSAQAAQASGRQGINCPAITRRIHGRGVDDIDEVGRPRLRLRLGVRNVMMSPAGTASEHPTADAVRARTPVGVLARAVRVTSPEPPVDHSQIRVRVLVRAPQRFKPCVRPPRVSRASAPPTGSRQEPEGRR